MCNWENVTSRNKEMPHNVRHGKLQAKAFMFCRVMVQGAGPSARYAHTLALVANRYLVATGGNDGKQTLADAWALDTSDKPYQWQKITDAGDLPPPRYSSKLYSHEFL